MRRELSKKCKALNFQNSLCPFSPAVSLYGHENWVMTERCGASASVHYEVSPKIKEVTLLKRRTSLEIQRPLEPLLLQIERSQLRWFGHVSRMPLEKLPNKLYLPKQVKKTLGRPRSTVVNQYYVEDLGWNCLGLHSSEMMGVMEYREVW